MEEVKIRKIDVENLKAVSSFTALFNGKSAHVTGANGIGKSTIIRAFTDRLRGLKPSIVTKIGEKEGKTVMELTDGCRFEWEYNDQGKDSLNYFTSNTIKPVRRDVFKHICGQYFPNQFDINKFLTTTEPAKRLKMISELVNVDLTEIQAKYKNAFDIRKDAKKELKILEAQIKPEPEKQDFENLNICEIPQKNVTVSEKLIKDQKAMIEHERDILNDKYIENKKSNDLKESEHKELFQKNLDEWFKVENENEEKIDKWNKKQGDRKAYIEENKELLSQLEDMTGGTFVHEFIGFFAANKFIDNMDQPEELKTFVASKRPELESLALPDPMPSSDELDKMKKLLSGYEENLIIAKNVLETKKAELSDLSTSKQVYDLQLKQYQDFQKEVAKQANHVTYCEEQVAIILEEIKAIISATKLPDEFSIDLTDKNDILFRTSPGTEHLAITNETLASSAIFIAAFKLQANYLEAFRVAHFDVSYLDYENREKVLKEAINMNIQLITESPAQDEKSSELQYKITED